MKRFIISILLLLLLASFSLVPTFAGINQISEVLTLQKELVNPDSGDADTPKTNYVAEFNKLGMAGRPESDNAALYYQKAAELYVKEPEGLKVSPRSWPKELPAQEQAMLRKWVQDNSRALEQLQLGSQKPYCWFQYTGEKLQTTEMPYLAPIRKLAFALQARAKLSAEDGNITRAINDIVALYKFGEHFAARPGVLVEKLVGIAVKSLSIRTAFNILDKKMVNADMMKSLEDRFKQLVTDYSEPFDIRGEKIFMQEQVETDPTYRGFKPYLKSALEYYDTMAAKTSWQLHNEQTQSITKDNPLIEILGFSIAKVIEIESRIRADEQALITTLAILRYNADSDGYPGALSQLVSAGYIKELPIDPFSNKPFVYKQTGQSFTLYSFGADYDDDGGLHSKWGTGEEGGDQVFWPLEQPQMAERPTSRERPFARTESPQRRATTFARSTAQPYLIDDDFEDYNDHPPDEIWRTWIDGYGVSINGATAGYPEPIDFLAGEHYMETTIVHGGDQSMPFFYDNTGTAAYSEATRTFAVPQDWTKAGVQTLVLYFYGTAGNTGQLYAKVNGSKIVYDGDAADIAKPLWNQWSIDLASLGVDLQNVTTLSIGMDGNGASGTLYFDDIRLALSFPATGVRSGSTLFVPSLETEDMPGDDAIKASFEGLGHAVTYIDDEEETVQARSRPDEPAGIENEESGTPQTNYVAELNKLGIAGRPESDNAAPYYQKAIKLFVKEPEGLKVSTRSWPKELPAQEQALLRKWVQDNSRALEQIQLGSRKPYCWFQHTGEKLQTTEMPHLYTRRRLALALQARAKLQAEDGNITDAINDIVNLYKFGAHIADGPKFLVEKLVGIAIKTLPIRTAFNILDRKMVDANLMKSLEDRFKQLVTDYNEPFDIRSEKLSLQEQVETDPKYRFFKPYLNSTLEYYDTIAAKNTWQLHNEKTQSITEDNPLIETAGSGIPSVIEIEYRTRADEQALITTLALLRYNADSDGYPGALPQLVSAGYIKELPIDPFSNKPFVYKRTRDSFTLYSFGADYDDDGGLHSKWGSGEEGGDQVFWPLERTQMAERPSGREMSSARTESPQRRATSFTRSTAQPYLIDDDDEEEYVPARPRPGRQKRTKTLHDAARNGDIDQVQLLLSKGADVNVRNRMNWTPLHTAVQNSKQALIEPLIAKGADVNAKNNRGLTPLHVAVNTSQKDAVALLIAEGADVNIMGGRGDNALSMAKRRQQTEIVELLLKHGAKEPTPQDLMSDRYYEEGNSSPGYEEQGTIRRGARAIRGTRTVGQSPVQVDILADPNGIKARIKTLGLQKALEEVAGKSQNEMRQWQQKRYDNRTLLIRTVQKQFEDEIGFIRKVAVEEKAKKTTETIDITLSGRQERLKKVSKELLTQKRELRQTQQTQPTRGRGRARTSGRGTGGRGQYPQRGQPYGGDTTEPLYGRGSVMPGTTRPQSTRRPSEEVDIETENEINQWLQADVEDKTNLAEAVHEQIWVEISSIRIVAVKEEAKKTTATIDGLLLYRQTRFEAFIRKMEAERQVLQQTQNPRIRGRGRYLQDGQMQQQNQPRPRGRRR